MQHRLKPSMVCKGFQKGLKSKLLDVYGAMVYMVENLETQKFIHMAKVSIDYEIKHICIITLQTFVGIAIKTHNY